MARGYDRLEYSLMNDIYDEQTYGYSTNGYSANESYSNEADYSNYEFYNDGYKSGYRAAMEAFGKKKKGFFANIWEKILNILKAIREKIEGLFKKKKSVPQKVIDAITSEKGKLVSIIVVGFGGLAAIIGGFITSYNKYKKDGSNDPSFGAYVKSCTNKFKKSLEDLVERIKANGGVNDAKSGPAKALLFAVGIAKTPWKDMVDKLHEIAEARVHGQFKKGKPVKDKYLSSDGSGTFDYATHTDDGIPDADESSTDVEISEFINAVNDANNVGCGSNTSKEGNFDMNAFDNGIEISPSAAKTNANAQFGESIKFKKSLKRN